MKLLALLFCGALSAQGWSFVNVGATTCPCSLGVPTMPDCESMPRDGRFVVDIINLEPNLPVICTINPFGVPGIGCVQALQEVLFFGFADATGLYELDMQLSLHLPSVVTYMGFMQLISFSSTTSYCTSNPILIYGTP